MQMLNKAIIAVLLLAAAGAGIWFLLDVRSEEEQALVPLGPVRVELPPVVSGDLKELVQTHDFRFRNELREPLRVASTTVSCTCTTATTEPEVVEPGAELVVRTVTVLDRAAGRHATIWVRFEDGRGVKMHLTASFRRPVVLSTKPAEVRADPESGELEFTLVWTGVEAEAAVGVGGGTGSGAGHGAGHGTGHGTGTGAPPSETEPVAALVEGGAEARSSGRGGPVPPSPAILHDRGEVGATFSGWSPATVDSSLFGAEGPLPGSVSFFGKVKLTRRSDRWPTVLTFRTPGADPLELNLRDLLPGE
jgi:hypothetical protein